MDTPAWGLLALFLTLLGLLAWPLGRYLALLCNGTLPGWMQRVEAPLFRLAGTSPGQPMHWRPYALALLAFNAIGALALYGLQRLQAVLPLDPAGMAAVSPDSSFNTAVSFVSNTNWQGYAGESTMSYLTQMLGLTVQNFFSAATGIAVAFALARGFAARSTDGRGAVGNFWVDLTRITLWLLLPLSFVLAIFFSAQGVIQNLDAYKTVSTVEATAYQNPKLDAAGQPVRDAAGNPVLEDARTATQTLAMGPVASQEAIKMLGTNGGGFFNANSAHPYENPTALTNFAQMLAIFLIPAALCFAFGRVVGDQRQGWAVLAAMTVLFVAAVVLVIPAEQAGNPLLGALGVDQAASALQAGGNMEGKELRFGITASAQYAVAAPARNMMYMAAQSAQPCACFFTMWPKVQVSPAETRKISSSCRKFVSGVGFSKPCAELALKKPPPLVPSILIASCDATGPIAMVCVLAVNVSITGLPCASSIGWLAASFFGCVYVTGSSSDTSL